MTGSERPLYDEAIAALRAALAAVDQLPQDQAMARVRAKLRSALEALLTWRP